MSTNVSGVSTNFFTSPQNGFTTTTSGSVSSGAVTVGLNSVAGYSNGDVDVWVIDPTDTNKKQAFTGVVDTAGSQVTSVKWTAGTNQTHALGATVVAYTTATHQALTTKGITQQHKQDGTHAVVTATSVTATGAVQGATVVSTGDVSDTNITLKTIRSETTFDYIASGCVLSGTGYGSTLAWSLTSGIVYIGGKRLTVASATGTVTASKDTYFDLLDPGSGTVATLVNTAGNIVANNAASPALAASSVRLGIIVSGANIAAATSVNQGQATMVLPIASSIPYAVTDSLGNLICPRDPNRKVLGYRQVIAATVSVTTGNLQITGLTVPVIVPTGRNVRVSTFGQGIRGATSGNLYGTTLWDGVVGAGTQLCQGTATAGGANYTVPAASISPILSPAAGLKTYNAALFTGAGTASYDAAAVSPGYVLVELV